MSVQIWLCALVFMLWSVAPGLDAGESLTMTVSPIQSFAPANLQVQVRLEPSTDNRALEVVADSSNFYRSSRRELDGDRAPRVVTLDFRSLPSGEYEVRGVLLDRAGHGRAYVRQEATVISFRTDR